MKYGLKMGWRRNGSRIKGTVVLVRSISVAEVVGWVSSETVGEDRANEMALESTLLSIGTSVACC